MTSTDERGAGYDWGYSVREPRWGSAEQDSVVARVKFQPLQDEISLIASPADPERQAREIFRRAAAGEFGEIAPFEAAPVKPSVSAQAIEAMRASLAPSPGKDLAEEIARQIEGSPEEISRGIVTYAESVLADRLATLLAAAGKEKPDIEALSFVEKTMQSFEADLISAKEAVALHLMEDIRAEILLGRARAFNTEYIRLYVNCLHSSLAEYMTYNITKSIEDDWIDLIFLDCYTLIGESLARRANPKLLGRLVE